MSLTDFRDYVPKRAVLGALMFMACMFSYVIRTNLSIIIVAMVNINTNKGSDRGPECSFENLNNSLDHTKQNGTMHNYGERFEWNQHIQGQLLSAYFYGTLPSSVPAGLLAEKFGGSRVVAFATLIPAMLNLMMPIAAEIHYGLVLMLRFIMGFFGSAVYPALHAMIARWVPPSEKGIFVWTMQGGPFGTFVTLAFCGAIISNYGWKAAYYSTSSFMLIFYILWVYLAYDTPDLHPTITEEEKSYITEQIGSSVSKKKTKLPVRHVITSGPFLVLLYAHVANMWGIYFISTNGPKYTLEVLGFNMKTGGAITGLPYIARLLAGILFAATGDYLRRKSFLSVGWIRKIFMIFSHMGPATCLLGVTFAGCNGFLAMAMMIAALAFNGAACQTNLQNHQDLAPNFAGSLYGIMNTLGSFPGFLIPPIVGILTNDHNGIIEWRVMFFLSAGVFTSATILFWIFGSASVQPWNNLDSNKSENIDDQDNQMNLTSKIPMSSDDEDENEEL